jgi:hypothetical protein
MVCLVQKRQNPTFAARGSAERESELLVSLIASGLIRMSRWPGVTKRQLPYEASLQLGLDRLSAACARAGMVAPIGVGDLVWEWCANRPIGTWPVVLPPDAQAGGDLMMINEAPSEFCVEWAVSAQDVVSEVHESAIVAHVKDVADSLGRPDLYALWRMLVVERSVLSSAEMLVQKNRFLAVPQWATWLQESYEPVPVSQSLGGMIAVCGSCGQWKSLGAGGSWTCSTPRCRMALSLSAPVLEPARGAWRLRPELVRFIALPGRPEVSLARALAARGAQVLMYPGLDALDLLAVWPDGYSIGIDVKDWVKPYLLARRIKQFPDWKPGVHRFGYQRACLVIPADRAAANPRYCAILRRHSAVLRAQPGIEVLTDKELIETCPDLGEPGQVVCDA